MNDCPAKGNLGKGLFGDFTRRPKCPVLLGVFCGTGKFVSTLGMLTPRQVERFDCGSWSILSYRNLSEVE